jgi:hypothetical protein
VSIDLAWTRYWRTVEVDIGAPPRERGGLTIAARLHQELRAAPDRRFGGGQARRELFDLALK